VTGFFLPIIMDEAQRKKCYSYSIRLLGKKDYSNYKMRQKLLGRDYDKEMVDDVIQEITEKKYLREDLYKEGRIKGFIRKGYNTKAILFRLSKERCHASEEEVLAIYEAMESTPDEQLFELIMKKVRIDYDFVSDKDKLKQKTLRYIASRGHSIGEAVRLYPEVLSQFLEERS